MISKIPSRLEFIASKSPFGQMESEIARRLNEATTVSYPVTINITNRDKEDVDEICKLLHTLGYKTETKTLDSTDYRSSGDPKILIIRA